MLLLWCLLGILPTWSSRLKEDYSFDLSKMAYKRKNHDLLTMDFSDNKNFYPLTQMQIWKIFSSVFPLSQSTTRQWFWSHWITSRAFWIVWIFWNHVVYGQPHSREYKLSFLEVLGRKSHYYCLHFVQTPPIFQLYWECFGALKFLYINFGSFLPNIFWGVFSWPWHFPPLIYLFLKTNKRVSKVHHKRIVFSKELKHTNEYFSNSACQYIHT